MNPPCPLNDLHVLRSRVRFGEFELDEANARLLRGGSAICLAPTPFGLLCALVRHPGSLLTKHALLDEAWGHRYVSDSVLKGAISDLRTVLGDDPRSPRFIETVPRRGYRFIAMPTTLQVSTAQGDSREPQVRSFIGRMTEVAQLRRAWDRATDGVRGIVWIAGTGMSSVGVNVRHRSLTLTLAATFYTDTFETQRENTDFGTLGLSWFF